MWLIYFYLLLTKMKRNNSDIETIDDIGTIVNTNNQTGNLENNKM